MKKRKIIILTIIVVLVFSLICTFELIKLLGNSNSTEEFEKSTKEYLEDRVIPQGVYQFTLNYDGDIDRETFYKKLNYATQYISDISKEIDSKDVSKYYNENSSDIFKYIGIETEEEFVDLSKVINASNIKEATFKYCAIEKETFVVENGYTKFNMTFNYEDGSTLPLEVKLKNNNSGNRPILKVLAP